MLRYEETTKSSCEKMTQLEPAVLKGPKGETKHWRLMSTYLVRIPKYFDFLDKSINLPHGLRDYGHGAKVVFLLAKQGEFLTRGHWCAI